MNLLSNKLTGEKSILSSKSAFDDNYFYFNKELYYFMFHF